MNTTRHRARGQSWLQRRTPRVCPTAGLLARSLERTAPRRPTQRVLEKSGTGARSFPRDLHPDVVRPRRDQRNRRPAPSAPTPGPGYCDAPPAQTPATPAKCQKERLAVAQSCPAARAFVRPFFQGWLGAVTRRLRGGHPPPRQQPSVGRAASIPRERRGGTGYGPRPGQKTLPAARPQITSSARRRTPRGHPQEAGSAPFRRPAPRSLDRTARGPRR